MITEQETKLLKLNTKVRLKSHLAMIGYISGHGINLNMSGNPYTVYLVELEIGYYLETFPNQDRCYVKTLVVSTDNVIEIK